MDFETGTTTTPTPGSYYSIQRGKGGLLTTTGRAYGLGAGTQRLRYAQRINQHPRNRKFWVRPASDFARRHFKDGIISFSPGFTCGTPQRQAKKGEKRCFARIWIPVIGKKDTPALPPDHLTNCAVPARVRQNEIDLIFEEIQLEGEAGSKKVSPRLSLFQNSTDAVHRRHFNCQALRWARRLRAIQGPATLPCEPKRGSTAYDTGEDIINAIRLSRQCLDRKIERIDIFGHSGSYGIFGSLAGAQLGIYTAEPSRDNRIRGGRVITDIPLADLSDKVVFVLHGCNLASGEDNFAQQLYDHLATTLSKPRVYGHWNGGCAGRDKAWRVYSKSHPKGRKLRSILSKWKVKNCCS